MRPDKRYVVLMVLICVVAMAAEQVAVVSARGAFSLRGAQVQPEGVPTWPVMAGDEIESLKTAVTVTFPDGSKVVLAPGSKCKVEMSGQTPVFRLLSGSASWDLKSLSAVKLYALDKPVTMAGVTGRYGLGGATGAATAHGGFWTAKTTAIVAGAAAAGGVAAGVAASQGGTPVSPRR